MTRGRRVGIAARRGARALSDERGLISLAEVLVAMAIIGLAAVSIVSGYGVANLSASRHQDTTRADHVGRLVAEYLDSTPYVVCPVPNIYEAGLATLAYPDGWDASTVSLQVTYWNGDTVGSSPTFGTCPVLDRGLQKIEATITSPSERGTRTLEVIKRSAA